MPFENFPKIKRSLFSKWRRSSPALICKVDWIVEEIHEWTRSMNKECLQRACHYRRSLLQNLYCLLLPNILFLKSYISSRNRKFLDIPWLWELFTGENLTTAEAKSLFTSAIRTKTTPADTNKRTERHKRRRLKRQ